MKIDHVQSRAAVIVTVPLPPVAPNDEGAMLTPTWHLSDEGDVTDVWVEVQAAARHAAASACRSLPPRIRFNVVHPMHPMHGARQAQREKFFLAPARSDDSVGEGAVDLRVVAGHVPRDEIGELEQRHGAVIFAVS